MLIYERATPTSPRSGKRCLIHSGGYDKCRCWTACGGDGGLVTKLCPTLAPQWTVALQVPLSMEFSRQGYWSGLSFPSPGDLPDPGIEPVSPALAGKLLTIEPPEKPKKVFSETQNSYKNSDLSLKEKKKKSLSGFLVHPK